MLKMMLEMSDSEDESEEVEKAISRGKAKAEKIIDVEQFLKHTGSGKKKPSPSTKLYQQIKSTPLRSCMSARKSKKRTTAKKSVVFGSPNAAEFDTLDPVKGGMTPLHKHVAKQMFRMDGHDMQTNEEDQETALNSSILATWEEEEASSQTSQDQEQLYGSKESKRSSSRRQSNIGLLYKNRPSLIPDSDDDRANLEGQFDKMVASPIDGTNEDPNRTVELSTLKNLVADESMDDIDNSEMLPPEDHTVELGSLNDLIGNSPLIRTTSSRKKPPPSPGAAEACVRSFERKRRQATPASLASNTVDLGNLSELAAQASDDEDNRTAGPGTVSALLKESPQSMRSSPMEQTVELGELKDLVDEKSDAEMDDTTEELQHTVELGQLAELAQSGESRGSTGSRKRKLGAATNNSSRSKRSRDTPMSKEVNVALHLSFSTMSTGSHSTRKDSFLANNAIENFLDTPSTQASSHSDRVKTPEVLARLKAKHSASRLLSGVKNVENSSSPVKTTSPHLQKQTPSPSEKLHASVASQEKRLSTGAASVKGKSPEADNLSAEMEPEAQLGSAKSERKSPGDRGTPEKVALSARKISSPALREVLEGRSASPSATSTTVRSPSSPIAPRAESSPMNVASQETEVVNASPVAQVGSTGSPVMMARSPKESPENDEAVQAAMRAEYQHRLGALQEKLSGIQDLMRRYHEYYNMGVTISEQLSVITSFEEKCKELQNEEKMLDSEIASARQETETLLEQRRSRESTASNEMKALKLRCLALELCPKLSLYQLKYISANALEFALAHSNFELRIRLAPGGSTQQIIKYEFRPAGSKLLGKKRKHCSPEVENAYEESLCAVVHSTLEETGKRLIGQPASSLHGLIPRLNQKTLRVMNLWEEIAVLCMTRPLRFDVNKACLQLKFDIVDIKKKVYVKVMFEVKMDRYPCGFGACRPEFEVIAGKDAQGLMKRLERVVASHTAKLNPLSRQCAQIEEIVRNH